jgi:hypothetical protein
MARSTSAVKPGAIFGGALAGALAVVLALSSAAGAATVVVTALVGPLQAAAGNGWAIHPDQTAGGSERFVLGPATPPAGHGSLELSVASSSDRALIFAVPGPGTGPTPPGNVGPIKPIPWAGMTGSSYSTFTRDTSNTASSVAVLKFVGYQVYNATNPLLSTGFTTLNVEPSRQGTVTANQWQKWTVTGASTVWQSNATGNFCVQATPCTLSQFAAQYADGAWGQVQLGLGSFGPGGPAVSSFVDDVTIAEGAATFGYNFEVATATPTPSTSSTVNPPPATSSAFVPGAGATGDSQPSSPASWLIALAGLAVVTGGSAAILRRRRGKHS